MKLVYQYRIKDSSCRKELKRMASAVNYVWNYCNEANQYSWKHFEKALSGYDLQRLTKGCGKELGLPSQVIQRVGQEYATRAKQYKRKRLNWRTAKRQLGWIPYNYQTITVEGDAFLFNGRAFRFWKSREIDGEIKSGSITEDSRGRWYLNLTIEKEPECRVETGREVGIDLGLKTVGVTSDGEELARPNFTKEFAKELAMAQRAKKKKRVTAIYAKIKNKRKDWQRKVAKDLCERYDRIAVGDVSSSKLVKTKMAKSVYDASWYGLKATLGSTAIRRGVAFHIVDEKWSTVACSDCGSKTGPSGLSALGVREWNCEECGSVHDRDTNAARNILTRCRALHPNLESQTL
jgi:IS605 OrfB family transposase